MGKMLFIRGGAVGDFILTMPAIKLVREQLPDNEIEILGYPSIAELATVTGLADRTRSIEDARLATFFAPGADLDEEWTDYFASFNVVISYLYDPDGFFAGNLERAGVKTLLDAPFRPEENDPPVAAALQLAQPLERFALFLDDPEMVLDYRSQVDSPLPESDATRVAIHPGSGSPSKNWSFESWIIVLKQIQNEIPDVEFVVSSGEAEHEVIDQFLDAADTAGLSFTHLKGHSLAELGATYEAVDFYLGHDSGISHLAGSAGVEGLLLFGPTDPKVWAPATDRMQIVQSSDGQLGGIRVEEVVAELKHSKLLAP